MAAKESEISKFLQSMPKKACNEFVQQSIMDASYMCVLFTLVFPVCLAMPIGGWVGRMFGLPFAGRLCIGIFATCISCYIFVLLFFRYQNWRLRSHLLSISVDGLLRICPACRSQQMSNRSKTCHCGCIVRPFSG